MDATLKRRETGEQVALGLGQGRNPRSSLNNREENQNGMGCSEAMATYAIEVLPGREVEAAGLLGDCAMAPRAEFEQVYGGKRVREVRSMLPGLVLIKAVDLAAARKACRRARGLAALRVEESSIEKLLPEAGETLRVLCGETGVAPASEGSAAGGLQVRRGALVGRESLVGGVSSRRKCAYVPIELGGKTVELEVGLRVTRRGDAR